MKPTVTSLIAVLALSLHGSAWAQNEAAKLPHGQYTVGYDDGKVTVYANEASTESLLQDFSQKSGISFNKFTGKTTTVTLNLDRVTVEEFLDRVIASYVTKSRKVDGAIRISSVTIMDEGAESPPPPPPPQPEEARGPAEPSAERGPEAISPAEKKETMSPRERRRRLSRKRRFGPEGIQQPEPPPPPAPGTEEGPPPPPEAETPQP
jgi:hypothetical protein